MVVAPLNQFIQDCAPIKLQFRELEQKKKFTDFYAVKKKVQQSQDSIHRKSETTNTINNM